MRQDKIRLCFKQATREREKCRCTGIGICEKYLQAPFDMGRVSETVKQPNILRLLTITVYCQPPGKVEIKLLKEIKS